MSAGKSVKCDEEGENSLSGWAAVGAVFEIVAEVKMIVQTNDPKGRDKKVTLEEFIEYYNNISMSIDDDNYFELMMNNSWRNNLNNSKLGAWKGDLSSSTRVRPQTSTRPY